MAEKKYRALVGMNFPDGRGGEVRVEPGDVITDLEANVHERTISQFIKQGAIEIDKGKRPKAAKSEEG